MIGETTDEVIQLVHRAIRRLVLLQREAGKLLGFGSVLAAFRFDSVVLGEGASEDHLDCGCSEDEAGGDGICVSSYTMLRSMTSLLSSSLVLCQHLALNSVLPSCRNSAS